MLKNKWMVNYSKFDTLSEAEDFARRSAVFEGTTYLYTATSKFTSPAYTGVTSEAVK